MDNWKKDSNDIFVDSNDEILSYPEEGNEFCFGIEDSSPWFNQRNDLIVELIRKHNLKGNFLDIGGGNGFQAKAIKEVGYDGDIYLIEPGYQGCVNSKMRGVQNVYCGLFQQFNFKEKNIKVCGLFDVIEHVGDDIQFLNELYEKIESGTTILINVPALNILWSEVDDFAGHYRRYSKKDINRITSGTDLKVVDFGYYFSFYVIPLFLLRVIPYRIGLKKNKSSIIASETKNHKAKGGGIQKHIDSRHTYWLKKIRQFKSARLGTSLYIVLRK